MSKLFIYYKPFVKSIHKTNHFASIKQKMHTQTSHTNFQRVSPFDITPVEGAYKARTCCYRRPFPLIYRDIPDLPWWREKERERERRRERDRDRDRQRQTERQRETERIAFL